MNSLNMYVSDHIHQLTSLYVDEKTKVAEKVSSENGFRNICNDENPLKNTMKTNVKSEGAFPYVEMGVLLTTVSVSLSQMCVRSEREGG